MRSAGSLTAFNLMAAKLNFYTKNLQNFVANGSPRTAHSPEPLLVLLIKSLKDYEMEP